MAKKVKLHPIFKLFTIDQVDYIQRAARMIRWPVNLIDATVHIPEDAKLSDNEDMTVNHLCNEFGFEIIHSDTAIVVNEIYSPTMLSGPGKQRDIEEVISEVKESPIEIGSKFYNTRDDSKQMIFSQKHNSWVMCYIGTMQPNYEMSKASLEVALSSGIWKRI